ncbi:MAG: DNA cytosine methyltransferase [Leptospirales bacterium]
MEYVRYINKTLQPKVDSDLNIKVLDLFAGCGGLSLGFEAAGFETYGYEMDETAATTYNNNLIGHCEHTTLSTEIEYPDADIVIGGPPCQPFSVRGKQSGLSDSRDGFPIFIDAIAKVNPEIWLFENVRGMLYKNKEYLNEVISSLSKLGYNIYYKLLNAKSYGVPQNRERVIVIGSKKTFSFPKEKDNYVTVNEAIEDLAAQDYPESKVLTPNMDKYIKKYEIASKCINPRDLWFDRPARTLTCRNLAGQTSDMQRIRLKNGERRMLLTNEAARLQSFPDWFKFSGSETQVFNQIGNSVAPLFSYHLASRMKEYILQNGLTERDNQYAMQMVMFE